MAHVNAPVEVTWYRPQQFPFVDAVCERLNVRYLDRLHEWLGDMDTLTRTTDQSTLAHRRFYEPPNHAFLRIYRYFVRDIVVPFVGSPVVFQRVPTFRVHLPNNVAVGEFHRDADYGHDAASINFWVPLTQARGSTAVHIEWPRETGRGDAYPIIEPASPSLDVGDVLVFDGVNLRHGNVPNETGLTRVSFDFHVIPVVKFVARPQASSINTRLPFTIGQDSYFDTLAAPEAH